MALDPEDECLPGRDRQLLKVDPNVFLRCESTDAQNLFKEAAPSAAFSRDNVDKGMLARVIAVPENLSVNAREARILFHRQRLADQTRSSAEMRFTSLDEAVTARLSRSTGPVFAVKA
jgi:hypothetical protein